MFFRDIIGQKAIKERFIQTINESRISHAQLFAGPEGSGNLALALAYAQYVSCTNKQNGDSCGTCPSCKKYARLAHPDLHFVYPVVKSPKFKDPVSTDYIEEWRKMVLHDAYFSLEDWFTFIGTDNAQGMIYAQESDEIIRKLNLKSYESEYKIMIIWMPEKMNQACSNKLLKMIEEPPSKTLFLLVSESEEQLITTIRSRCQLTKVPAIDEAELVASLNELPESSGTNTEQIAHLSRGNYRRALQLLKPENQDRYNLEKFKELMRLTYGRKFLELFTWVAELSTIGRERQKSFLQYALAQVRENFVFNLKNPKLVYMDEEEQAFSSRFSPFINERNIMPISEELEKSILHISMNGNPRIIFTDMALRIVKLIRR
ncbi:DNA polymerase III subunit delta' [Mangrovibacterium marinum]|uniref:DNA polymerase-3 subunit delta n=1 Tax=Mangrovibacterium marinum TaxID=1639118 RepID=A0A2T5C6K3_9BACT|nr:DNA polymerase III subunit delta' [Mangrovibacterium marinum]PTN10583.1 DNA polymerase-3 subunit delta' [Mangrovibacterium marinum]